MVDKEGKQFISRSKSVSGEIVEMSSEHGGTGEIAVQEQVVGLEYAEVTRGRTVELAPYEFARFDIGMRLYIPEGISYEDARLAATDYVTQMVNKELAELDKEEYTLDIDGESYDVVSRCVGRSWTLSYGLTLKGAKRFESERVDIGRSRYLSDGEDALAAMEQLGNQVGSLVAEEEAAIHKKSS